MSVLIVVESCFGNTHAVAEALASGVGKVLGGDAVAVAPADEAPQEVGPEVELLLVGAPTQDYSLPKPQTRKQAAAKGAGHASGRGVREWIGEAAPRPGLRTHTFDTSLELRFSLGSASKAAYKALRKRGFDAVERGESFRVETQKGPLRDGEWERAEAWGAQLMSAGGQ